MGNLRVSDNDCLSLHDLALETWIMSAWSITWKFSEQLLASLEFDLTRTVCISIQCDIYTQVIVIVLMINQMIV